MILDNELTGDVRVENEIVALRKANYDVFVLCLNYGQKPAYEEFFGAKIFRIPLSLFAKNKLKGLNETIFNFYPRFWTYHIRKFISKNKLDVLHVHDLWMLGAAFRANKKFKLPVVADLHENFVHALNYYKYANTFPGNILISKKRWARKEKVWTNKADFIITVIEEAVDRYKKLGNDENKIFVVPNYLNIENFNSDKIFDEIANKFNNNFTLTYIGGFDVHRGIETIINAIPILVPKIENLKVVLVGTGSNFNDLKNLAQKIGVSSYVSFEGWQTTSKLPSYIYASDVCLIPHLKSTHTDNTIPHKLFQYMSLGKPVVSTNCKPLERILTETNSGLIYPSGNQEELAERIIELFNKPELREKLGKNGQTAVKNKYNWEQASKQLVKLYSQIEAR